MGHKATSKATLLPVLSKHIFYTMHGKYTSLFFKIIIFLTISQNPVFGEAKILSDFR